MSYAISERLRKITRELAGGIPGEDGVFVRRDPLQHMQAYPAAGSTRLEFFNVARTKFNTNMPQQSTISANTVFLLQAVRCFITQGIDENSTRVAAGILSGASLAPAVNAEELRTIIAAPSEITLEINNRQIFNVIGLHNFAAGGGPAIDAAYATTTAATDISTANVANGSPFKQNGYAMLPGPFPIMPGQQIRLVVEFEALLTMAGAGIIQFELDGLLLSESSAS